MDGMIRERWLWVSIAAAVGLTATLLRIRVADQLPTPADEMLIEPSSEQEEQSLPSRLIPLGALKTLVDSPVPSISCAALALVNKRLGDRRTYQTLLASVHRDLDSSDEDSSRKARLALGYLDEHVSMSYLPPSPMSFAWTASPSEEQQPDVQEQLQGLHEELQRARRQGRARARPTHADRDGRRRRREAMLLHEGSGELTEGDIIELNAALAEMMDAPNE